MTTKSLLLFGLVSACSLALAGTKSYAVHFDQTAAIGAVQLAPGAYKLTVEKGTATFTDVHTKKSVSAPAKVQTAPGKFSQTAVESVMDGKTERVAAIELGGTATKVEFGSAATHGSK